MRLIPSTSYGSPQNPYPLIDGGRIAVYEPLRRLAARGHRITLLTFRPPEQNVAELAPLTEFCRLESLPNDTRTRPLAMARNLFSTLPYTVAKYQSPLMAQKLAELLARETFDLVHLEQLHMAGYQAISKGKWGVPTLLRQENIESHLVERYWRAQTGVRRLYGRLLAARMRRYEAEQCTAVDGCLAITAEDAQRLRCLSPEANVVVVPAGSIASGCNQPLIKSCPIRLSLSGQWIGCPMLMPYSGFTEKCCRSCAANVLKCNFMWWVKTRLSPSNN
ncbi:MAG: glycosyltransferase [Chloroflexi bacterium]|nr:glycosyltransferase [Chloroflexota bacterium]